MNRYIEKTLCALVVMCSLSSATGQTGSSTVGNAPRGGAIILDLSGKVHAQGPDGGNIAVVRNGALPEGTLVKTDAGSKVLLRLDDGSEILLKSDSKLALKQESVTTGATLFEFILGTLRAVVSKRFKGTPSFQLGTPTAIVAVRGTQFDVEVNSHRVTEVDVEQGVVQVMGRYAAGKSVILEPGFSTRVGPDMLPEPPIRTNRIRPDAREKQEESKATKGWKRAHRRPGALQSPSEAGEGNEQTNPMEPTEPTEKPH